jgi:rubrerythrin
MDVLEAAGYVPFYAAGTAAAGEFHCSDCGYGVSVQQQLPVCPMCGGTSWELRKPR